MRVINKRSRLTGAAIIADGALLFAALIWGGDYIAAKLTLGEISPLFLTALRFGLQSGLGLIYLTLLGTLGIHLLVNIGLKHTSPVHGGVIITTEAAFAAIFAYFLLKEQFTGRMIIGCILIFAAILITVIGPYLYSKLLRERTKKSF